MIHQPSDLDRPRIIHRMRFLDVRAFLCKRVRRCRRWLWRYGSRWCQSGWHWHVWKGQRWRLKGGI